MSYSSRLVEHWSPRMNLVRLAQVSTELCGAISRKDLEDYESALSSFEYWVKPVEDADELRNLLSNVERWRGDEKLWAAMDLRTTIDNRIMRYMNVPVDDIVDAMNDDD